MNKINSNRLRSALYARNPAPNSIQDRLDTVHKARYVGKKAPFSVQNLDAFALLHTGQKNTEPIRALARFLMCRAHLYTCAGAARRYD